MLPPDAHERLTKLCGMLSSSSDNERSVAAMMATDLLRAHGMTWADLLAAQQAPPNDVEMICAFDAIRECYERIDQCDREWDRGFLQSLYTKCQKHGYETELTPKQWMVLERIGRNLGVYE